jgi:hypothetical protein
MLRSEGQGPERRPGIEPSAILVAVALPERDYCVPEAFGRAGVGVCAGTLSLVVGPGDVIAGGWVLAVRVRSGPAELNMIVAATNTIAAMPSGMPQPARSVRGRSLPGRFPAFGVLSSW